MFNIDIRNARKRYSTPCFSVSIVNFEQVNVGWDWNLSKWNILTLVKITVNDQLSALTAYLKTKIFEWALVEAIEKTKAI